MGIKYGEMTLGIFFIFWGAYVFFNKGYYSQRHDYFIDFGGLYFLIGPLMIIVGCLFVIIAFRKKQ
jgi:uncharacterized membrane protein